MKIPLLCMETVISSEKYVLTYRYTPFPYLCYAKAIITAEEAFDMFLRLFTCIIMSFCLPSYITILLEEPPYLQRRRQDVIASMEIIN